MPVSSVVVQPTAPTPPGGADAIAKGQYRMKEMFFMNRPTNSLSRGPGTAKVHSTAPCCPYSGPIHDLDQHCPRASPGCPKILLSTSAICRAGNMGAGAPSGCHCIPYSWCHSPRLPFWGDAGGPFLGSRPLGFLRDFTAHSFIQQIHVGHNLRRSVAK